MEQKRKRKHSDIAICPLCGEYDRTIVTEKGSYDELLEKNKDACVTIECWRCGLLAIGYSMDCDIKAYEFVRASAAHKWNRLSDKMWKVENNG